MIFRSVFFQIIFDIGFSGLALVVAGLIQLLINKYRKKRYPQGKPPSKVPEGLIIVGIILVAVIVAIYFLTSIVSSMSA